MRYTPAYAEKTDRAGIQRPDGADTPPLTRRRPRLYLQGVL